MREKYERKNISLENQHWKPNYLLQDLYHVSATIPGSSAKVNVYKCFFKWIWTSAQEAWGWCIQKSRSQISITESEWNHKASLHWFLTCFFRFAFIFHNSRHSFLNVPFQKVSTEILSFLFTETYGIVTKTSLLCGPFSVIYYSSYSRGTHIHANYKAYFLDIDVLGCYKEVMRKYAWVVVLVEKWKVKDKKD